MEASRSGCLIQFVSLKEKANRKKTLQINANRDKNKSQRMGSILVRFIEGLIRHLSAGIEPMADA